ncbi:hypothetical protein BT96DRAFT_835112 [Gymnopus androsaceus JB14]|uniref:Uncharacterized protein n=1 Tax=Gymnopus androsaceus JB14 TaxID=1447944 RepID=A0A6A4GU41_9AGAR|nr:hypothetical protein BT96DRAFT_835112 [Gymnopus androsaceus JB14]
MLFTEGELDAIQRASKAGTRQIRDSDIGFNDFNVLIEGGRMLNSSLVNALAAQIQADSEAQGESPAFCVLSSWLGPLVENAEKEGGVTGLFDLHIQQAVSRHFNAVLSDAQQIEGT